MRHLGASTQIPAKEDESGLWGSGRFIWVTGAPCHDRLLALEGPCEVAQHVDAAPTAQDCAALTTQATGQAAGGHELCCCATWAAAGGCHAGVRVRGRGVCSGADVGAGWQHWLVGSAGFLIATDLKRPKGQMKKGLGVGACCAGPTATAGAAYRRIEFNILLAAPMPRGYCCAWGNIR